MQRVTGYERDIELYTRHSVELTRYAAALVGPSDAADVVSDAVTSLLRSGRLSSADSPLALLYRAVLAKAQSHHRSMFTRRSRERRFAETVTVQDPELRPDVIEAVVSLSPRQRACVYLTHWEDLTQAQIAERLGISIGSVKSHMTRANARLREVLDE